MALTTQQQQDILKYAVGIYGASAGGYFAELGSYVAGGMTAPQLATALAGSNSFKNLTFAYSDASTNDQFATTYLNNLLGSSVTAGTMALAKTWFLNQIATVGRAQAVVNAIDAIFSTTDADPDLGNAHKQLVNKIDVATDYTINQNGTSTDLNKLQQTVASVTQDPATVTAAKTTNAAGTGETFTLTTNVDTINGTAGNDVINGTINTAATFSALDSIDGGAGSDLLNIQAITDFALPGGAVVTNVEKVTINAAAKVGAFVANAAGNIDFSTLFAGVQELNITGGATEVDFKAPTSAAVTVTGAVGGVEVVGGASQTVSLAAQGGNLQLSKATGAINVTSTQQLANTITIDDGTNVSVTAGMSATAATTQGAITIGNTTKPTGTVTVTNTVSNAAGANSTGSAITINGGSVVTVNQTATQAVATAAGANNTLTQGAVTVNGTDKITSVTVSQSSTASAQNTVIGVTAVTEVNTLTFKALAATETLTINGLTFTAGAAGTTAAETAAAFANLDSGAKQGYSTKGTYNGTWAASTFTSAANSGDTVVFTGTAAGARTDLTAGGSGTAPTIVVTTDGVTKVDAKGRGAIVQGAVQIDDTGAEADTLTTASVTGYANGSFVKSDALTTLTLAKNTANASMAVHNATATALGLTLDTLADGSTVNLDAGGAKYTTLNIATTGGNSAANITASVVTALTVDGTKTVDLSSSTFTALKTLTVKGSAGVTADISALASQEAVDTTASTGTSTITLDATKATYTGGAGVDKVTLSAAAPSKNVNLGAGNDTLTLATGTTTATGTLSGGDGTDTLVMAMANAVTATSTATFQNSIDGFEKLQVNGTDGGAAGTVNVANLDNINYVINNQIATVAAAKEVVKVTLTGAPIDGDTFIFNGTTVTYVDVTPTLAEFITAIAGDAYADWDVTASDATSVTFTAKVAEARTDLVSGDFTGTYAGTKAPSVTTPGVTAVTASGLLTVDNLASGGTIELIAGGAGATVLIKDAATGTADVLNVVTQVKGANLDHGTVTAANVETINLTVTDTPTGSTDTTINKSTLTLTADKATSLTITGSAALDLTLTGSAKLTTIDGSAMTAALNVTSVNTTSATTIKGGAEADTLKAATGTTADVLIGGAGADHLYANKGLTTMTGGDGYDTFYINAASANVNSYATITDATKGDYIVFNDTAGTELFKSAAVTLGDTAVFQDYANAAINSLAQGEIGWFQYGGNTYVVQDASNTTAFVNGTDYIVKLAGVVDLSLASYDTADFAIRIG